MSEPKSTFKIFILEDDLSRIAAFQIALGDIADLTICQWLDGARGAYEDFKPPYDMLLLDHDLGGMVYLDSEGIEETGYRFCEYLRSQPALIPKPYVLIHSYNADGAKNMQGSLYRQGLFPAIQPFGPTLLKMVKDIITQDPLIQEVADGLK